jgi:hypothetical protein
MKELDVKAMLADPNIPDSYKLGGRLDERFLAGVEYAEAAMEKSSEFWVAKERSGIIHFFINKPSFNEDYECFEPTKSKKVTSKTWLPEITFENSPRKVRLILEDE